MTTPDGANAPNRNQRNTPAGAVSAGAMAAVVDPAHAAALPTTEQVLLTIRQFVQHQSGMTEGGVRWAIFHADSNGLAESGAIVRFGRRVLIDTALWMTWLRTNPTVSPPKAPTAGQKVAPTRRPQHRPTHVAILEG
jgi:hypothetical protein